LAGHGKTSLYNKLCDQNESAGFATYCRTSKATNAQCKHLSENQTLKIYDSPGIIEQSSKGIDEIINQLK
jgi:predicted GTPase